MKDVLSIFGLIHIQFCVIGRQRKITMVIYAEMWHMQVTHEFGPMITLVYINLWLHAHLLSLD